METHEEPEDALMVSLRNADAFVDHLKRDLTAASLRLNPDLRCADTERQRVGEQGTPHQTQLFEVGHDHRQLRFFEVGESASERNIHPRARLFDLRTQTHARRLEAAARVDALS